MELRPSREVEDVVEMDNFSGQSGSGRVVQGQVMRDTIGTPKRRAGLVVVETTDDFSHLSIHVFA